MFYNVEIYAIQNMTSKLEQKIQTDDLEYTKFIPTIGK